MPRPRRTPLNGTIEGCPARLDAGELLGVHRRAHPDLWAQWAASGGPVLFPAVTKAFAPSGVRLAQVVVRLAMDGPRARASLSWCADDIAGEQAVELVAAPVFGNRLRWLWCCPWSGRFVAQLYLPAGARGFASRQAHGLVYSSQLESPPVRAARRARKLRARLGEIPPVLGAALPPPPSRMQAATYVQTCAAIRQAEEQALAAAPRHALAAAAAGP
jgi:hypothetical protein